MQKLYVAEVYVDKTTYRIDMPFTYLVPINLVDTLKRGCRVIVPFSNANRKVQGLVGKISEFSGCERQLKTIALQLDVEPIMTDEMFGIIEFLVRNTFCTYYEAVRAILPVGTNVDIVERYRLTCKLEGLELAQFSTQERRIIEFLRTAKTAKELSVFLDCTVNPLKRPVVKRLVESGIISQTHEINPKVAPKTIKLLKLRDDFDRDTVRLSPKQRAMVDLLGEVGVASVKELSYLCAVTEATVKKLIPAGIAEQFESVIQKQYLPASSSIASLDEVVLSDTQKSCYDGIEGLMNEEKPHCVLLHGITGSGKTQVYIKLIEHALKLGKTAMLLVPEIALTPQMVCKFSTLFGDIVALTHSNLSLGERLEQFNRIRAKSVRIVIGTRSAVFAPLTNIGIIILDEEGEQSYKSESSPRYHAREIAKLRSLTHNATLVLGSATPSIDSFYRTQIGKYSLFSLDERFNNATLPSVYIVDMLQEQKKDNFSPISDILQQQIAQNLKENEQTILFINRRGYNTYATCMQCSSVIQCPSCDVAMTYHKANSQLMCHYCGHSKPFEPHCDDCGGAYIKLTGVGTQKLEDELELMFPSAHILRMDSDTIYAKDAYEKKFEEFRQLKYDIMVGTQMIAKGLDFPNVTLVGVINADSGLYSEDFMGSERVFSLITQVVGRSGRSEKSGRAYIQSMNPDNPVIKFASNQDYISFYKDEIESRKTMIYPPYCDICVLGFSGFDAEDAQKAANYMVNMLVEKAKNSNGITMKILGVAPAQIYKINNKYRYRVIIKCRFNNNFKQMLAAVLKSVTGEQLFSSVNIFADINGSINI